MELRVIAAVGIGAALGGIVRLLISQLVIARAGASYGFYATLCINVSGSFLIGLVVQTVQARAMISPLWRPFLVTGVLGGYTTFSTFSLEALSLATDGLALTSLFYVAASVVLGIAAAFGGIATGRALAH